MRNFKNKLLIFILLLGYTLTNAEIIKIPPLVIESKKKSSDNPTAILSNLKKAISNNKKSHQLSKEEEAKEILEGLKRSITTHAKPLTVNKVKKQKKSIKKKIHPLKKKQNVKIVKKSIKKKISSSKRKPKVKIVKKNLKQKIKPIKRESKIKIVKKRANVITLKTQPTIQQRSHVKTTTHQSTKPIGFVKTLGVVGKSEVYEVNDLAMDKREEVTNDGVVDMATATTDKLENLPFVKPLEVIEVTKPFEASEAKKYQLDER